MAEALKRWSGESWQTVAAVNRAVIEEGGGLIAQPTYTHDWPVPPFDDPDEELTPMDRVALSYDYTIE